MVSVGDIAPALVGQPVFGLPVELGAKQRHPVAVCFVRHLGSPFCRAALAQLQARYAEFDVVGAEGLSYGQGRVDGDPRQLPAWFVVGPGGRLRFVRLGASVTEGPPIDAMLEAVCSA